MWTTTAARCRRGARRGRCIAPGVVAVRVVTGRAVGVRLGRVHLLTGVQRVRRRNTGRQKLGGQVAVETYLQFGVHVDPQRGVEQNAVHELLEQNRVVTVSGVHRGADQCFREVQNDVQRFLVDQNACVLHQKRRDDHERIALQHLVAEPVRRAFEKITNESDDRRAGVRVDRAERRSAGRLTTELVQQRQKRLDAADRLQRVADRVGGDRFRVA